MDYFDEIMKAVDYIEDNLKNNISQEEVAKHCGFSMYHFHRVFQNAVKDSITGYIRERRLTHAAHDLLTSDIDIIHLALDYHFETHESFTRAFKKMFGVTPSMFRKDRDSYQTLLRVSQRRRMDPVIVSHLIQGLSSVPHFVFKESFTVIGVSMHSSQGGNFGIVWEEFNSRSKEIPNVSSRHALGLISRTGINVEFDYIACVEVSPGTEPPAGMVRLDVPDNEYAVFTHIGDDVNLSDSWSYALGIWLPKSKLKRANGPEFELYHPRSVDSENDDFQQVDIYIPIKRN